MQHFIDGIIKDFIELERVRKRKLDDCNVELEKICRLPAEERIEKAEKMRSLLRLKEFYEELDIKIVQGEKLFFKGEEVVSYQQIEEIDSLIEECLKEEEIYTNVVKAEQFVSTDELIQELNDYILVRETMLQTYVTKCMLPAERIKKDPFMNTKEYNELIKLFSELHVAIKGRDIYVNNQLLQRNEQYLDLMNKINAINRVSSSLMDKIKR